MTVRVDRKIPLTAVTGQLYGYIYCMLVSNILVGMPLFGGALFLCGRAVIVAASVFSKRNRQYLPTYSRIWMILLMTLLLGIGGVLIGIYPAAFESEKVWVLYAAAALCLLADGMTVRMVRLTETSRAMTGRAMALSACIEAILIAAMSIILIVYTGWAEGWPLAAGFAVMTVARAVMVFRRKESWRQPDEIGDHAKEIHSVKAYHSMEWISLLLVMAVELTTVSLYALLATDRRWLLQTIAIAVGCTLIPAFAGTWALRHFEKKGRKDPTWLLITGLLLWLTGIVLCSRMLGAGQLDYIRVNICLAICTVGGTLSLTGLRRIERIMPDAVSVTGQEIPAGYWRMRLANWELAGLLGDVLALIALSIFCFVNGGDLPQSAEELAARFQPLMIVPVILVIIGALISVYYFPLSGYYIRKLRKFLKLQEEGEENDALRQQLQHVVAENYHQPYLSRFLTTVFKLFYKHTLVNEDHIHPCDDNPLVFLCNHGEINGPIVCKMYIPVSVRVWTISMMMYDQKEVTRYVYENTYSKQTSLPVFVRKLAARFIGWLSVNVMNQIESIPVYRESPLKLRETVRKSIEAMEAGDNLLIFPENPEHDEKYERGGIGKMAPGFVMLAEAYWKKTGKQMRFMPMYVNKFNRTLTFGNEVVYQPENGYRDEQTRILAEVEEQIRAMAETPRKKTEGKA